MKSRVDFKAKTIKRVHLFFFILFLSCFYCSGQSNRGYKNGQHDSLEFYELKANGLPLFCGLRDVEKKLGKPDSIVHFTEEEECYAPDTIFYYYKGYQYNKVIGEDSLMFVSVDFTIPGSNMEIRGLRLNNKTRIEQIKKKFPLAQIVDSGNSESSVSEFWLYFTGEWRVISVVFKQGKIWKIKYKEDCS